MDGRPHGGPYRPAIHEDARVGDVHGGVAGSPLDEVLVRLVTADFLTSSLRPHPGSRQSSGDPGEASGLVAGQVATAAEAGLPRTVAFGALLLGPTPMTGG